MMTDCAHSSHEIHKALCKTILCVIQTSVNVKNRLYGRKYHQSNAKIQNQINTQVRDLVFATHQESQTSTLLRPGKALLESRHCLRGQQLLPREEEIRTEQSSTCSANLQSNLRPGRFAKPLEIGRIKGKKLLGEHTRVSVVSAVPFLLTVLPAQAGELHCRVHNEAGV